MTIKLGKKTLIVLIILAVIAAIYNVIYFAVPFNRALSNAAFWITYGCTWAALVFAGVTVAIAFNKKELKSKIFGIPVHCVGYTLVLFQLLIDGVVMGVGNWYEVYYWIPLIVEVILFGLSIVAVTIRNEYRNFIDKIDEKDVKKKEFIKELRVEVDSLLRANKVEALKPELEKLAETVRFTDPVSHSDVIDVEDQIVTEFETLQKAVADGEADKARTQVEKILNLLDERKARLKNARK